MVKKTLFAILCTALLLAPFQKITAQPGEFRGRGGFGGPGNTREGTQYIEKYDKDGNGWLNTEERKAARQSSSGSQSSIESRSYGTPGPKITTTDVKLYSDDDPLYDIRILRTLFLEFEDDDWESELEFFYHTDVEVPAKLTVDGKTYKNVGVRFRGNTSYQFAQTGQKRPLNLSMDFIENGQNLYGYRTLNLHNSSTDPTFLRQVLYQQISREYIPALKANYIRLVINGESWGIYINYQQFNTDFIQDEFDTREGARWKVPMNKGRGGGGGGGSGLTYLGESAEAYKSLYEIKSEDEPGSWADLINLCRVLNQTPADKLLETLEPILNIDGALKFLALENALINNDGYWARASDYLIYQDKECRFHIIPYDTSETMSEAEGGGPGGFGRGRGFGRGAGEGVTLDPLVGTSDSGKPLLSKLLVVPSLRQRYLSYINDIAENWLDWNKIRQIAKQYQSLIAADIETDIRKLSTTEAFVNNLTQDSSEGVSGRSGGGRGRFGGGASISLKSFVEQRSEYLLGLQ
jgi:hypothetical protein